jgi:hypothetical protein
VKPIVQAWALLGLLAACGRTQLSLPRASGDTGEAGAADQPAECALDSDCSSSDPCLRAVCEKDGERFTCQTLPISCDDGDACTRDACDSAAGGCVHERALDADHDGFVGKAPDGVPAACGGSDCNDGDASVHPGAAEACDGEDNDCNGNVDDGAAYTPLGSPVLVAPTTARAELGGFAFDGSTYGLTYSFANTRSWSYFETLGATGQIASGPVLVSEINADTFAGSLDFSGKSYLTAWNDARQAGSYEIYLTRFDATAQKLMPDVRVTNAPGFSLRPSVRYTGSEYVVVWEDQRFLGSGQGSAIFAHRVSEKGELVGGEIRLTTPDENADFAAFDVSRGRLGVAYVVEGPPTPDGSEPPTTVRFRTFDTTLADGTGPVDLGTNGQAPTVQSTNSGFVVAWHTGDEHSNWGSSIQAASLDDHGRLVAAGAVTSGDTLAKDRALVSFGDRLLLVWSATRPARDRFELWYELFDAQKLTLASPRAFLAGGISDTDEDLANPRAVRGQNGEVGVVFEENPSFRSYFMRLGCARPSSGPR